MYAIHGGNLCLLCRFKSDLQIRVVLQVVPVLLIIHGGAAHTTLHNNHHMWTRSTFGLLSVSVRLRFGYVRICFNGIWSLQRTDNRDGVYGDVGAADPVCVICN